MNSKRKQRGISLIECTIVLAAATSIILVSVGAYVVFHFISKFW